MLESMVCSVATSPTPSVEGVAVFRRLRVRDRAAPLLASVGLLAVILSQSACTATGPVYAEHAAANPNPPPGMGRVYIYRPSALPIGNLYGTHINDVEIEEFLPPRSFFAINQPQGDVRIRTYGGEQILFSLGLGEMRYVRIAVSHGLLDSGHMYPELVGNQEGRAEIQGLRLAAEVSGHADPFR